MILTQFQIYMSNKCLEYLAYQSDELEKDLKMVFFELPIVTEWGLIRPDELDIHDAPVFLTPTVLQVSQCYEAIRFTYRDDGNQENREIYFSGEAAQKLFNLCCAGADVETLGKVNPEFKARHANCQFVNVLH